MKPKLMSYFFYLVVLSSLGFSEVKQSNFQHLLNSDYQTIKHDACDAAKDFQYVFVAGIFNELMPYYFQDYQNWLVNCNVPQKHIVVARPYSGDGLLRASEGLKTVFNKLVETHPNKALIIIGHSKGAPEALLAAFESTINTQNHIAKIVSIQGSFGGSPIADMALHNSTQSSRLSSNLLLKIARRLAILLRRVETAYGKKVTAGVSSVKTKESSQFWRTYLNTQYSSAIIHGNKIIVLQTYKNYRRLNPFFFLSGEYLDRITGERTDGAIPLSAQVPPLECFSSAILELDHLDTVLPKRFSFSSPEIRHQILSAVILSAERSQHFGF